MFPSVSTKLVLIAVGLLMLALAWRMTRKRHPSQLVAVSEEPQCAPPGNLPAPAVAWLMVPSIDFPYAFLSIVVDMCHKDILAVDVRHERRHLIGHREFYLLPRTAADHPWERLLLEQLPGSVRVSKLRAKNLRRDIGNALDLYLQSCGLYEEKNSSVRPGSQWMYKVLSIFGALALSIGVGLQLARIAEKLALTVGTIVFTIAWAYVWPDHQEMRATSAGLQAMSKWAAFGKYLKATEESSDDFTSGRFGVYLPYAVALGIGSDWIHAAARAGVAAPHWFRHSASPDDGAGPSLVALGDLGGSFEDFLESVKDAFGFPPPRGWCSPGGNG